MTLGPKIKELRSQKGFTQRELADRLHVSFQTISKWENDENEPDISTLKELASLFDCSVNELINDSNDSEEKKIVKYRGVYKTNCVVTSKSVDEYHGYIDGVKKLDNSFLKRNLEFNKAQLLKYEFSKTVLVQHDSLVYFFIDEENKVFGFFFNFIPQFVCPFENFASVALSDSNSQTGYKNTRAFGVGIGRNPSFAVGSIPQSVTNLPLHYYLTINYFDENGTLCDYRISFDCNRTYILHDGTAESVDDMNLFSNSLSQHTNTKLREIISLLTAIKDVHAKDNLPQITKESYLKDLSDVREFNKQYHEDLNSLVNSQKHMLSKDGKNLLGIIIGGIFIIGVFIILLVLYNKYK